LLRSLFDLLLKCPDGLQAKEALAQLAAVTELTPYESGTYDTGARRFEKIIRFATINCVKAGWMAKEKGRWRVTDAGKEAHERLADGEKFMREAARLFRLWRANQSTGDDETEGTGTVDPTSQTASVTFEEAEEQAWGEIENCLRTMPPYEFQNLVAELLRAMGYHVSWIAPPGPDGGIDIVAWSDPLGTRPPRIKVQVKRQGKVIDVDGLRSFMALLGNDDAGLFVSIGGFTKYAAEEARTQETRKVTLIPLELLFDLWVEHYSRLSDDARRRLPLRPIYFLAPEA
jgi:restriction system protein